MRTVRVFFMRVEETARDERFNMSRSQTLSGRGVLIRPPNHVSLQLARGCQECLLIETASGRHFSYFILFFIYH